MAVEQSNRMAVQRGKTVPDVTKKRMARLVLNLKDANAEPVAASSRVLVSATDQGHLRYSAVGKDKEVTLFTFELPAGEYSVHVDCKGYEDAQLLVTIRDKEELFKDVSLRWITGRERNKGNEEKDGEQKIIDGRFEHLFRILAAGVHISFLPEIYVLISGDGCVFETA